MTALTPAMEDYLRTIHVLGGETTAVSTTALAEALRLTPASATGMIKKLAELNLVQHEPYRGVMLTDAGSRIAREVLRHHRLIELYLAQALGYSWDQVHEEADRLEHHISEEFEARIFEALGKPTHDPHGDPIPSYEGELPAETGRPLSEMQTGDTGTVRRVLTQDSEILRYLGGLGIVPHTNIEIIRVAPRRGPITVKIDNLEHALGYDLASQIVVDGA